MDEDQQALLTAMYQSDDDEPKQERVDPTIGPARTRRLWVGAVAYEVPTVEYVSRLEQLIQGQARIIERQQNDLKRLNHFMMSTRNYLHRQNARIAELRNEPSQREVL